MRCGSHVRLAEVRLVTAWPGIGISVHLQALCTRGLPFTDMLLHLSLAIQTQVCIRAHERRSGERAMPSVAHWRRKHVGCFERAAEARTPHVRDVAMGSDVITSL